MRRVKVKSKRPRPAACATPDGDQPRRSRLTLGQLRLIRRWASFVWLLITIGWVSELVLCATGVVKDSYLARVVGLWGFLAWCGLGWTVASIRSREREILGEEAPEPLKFPPSSPSFGRWSVDWNGESSIDSRPKRD